MRRNIQTGLFACGAFIGLSQTALAATALENGTPVTGINGAASNNSKKITSAKKPLFSGYFTAT